MSSPDFKFVRPLAITDAMLISSSVPETVAATYSGATAYVVGNRVGLAPVDGVAQLVYECIQNGTGQPLPVPPATTTAYWQKVGEVYPLYSGAAIYGRGAIVSNIGTNVHELYESLVAGNVGNALTDAAKWLPLGATNRWKMFDEIANSQTISDTDITIVLSPGVLINSAIFSNVTGASIRVQQSVSGYDRTILLNSHLVVDWYDWYYEALTVRDDVPFMDVPPYPASSLTITIAAVGGSAACGVAVFGQQSIIGTTLAPLSRGINDYSRVIEDAWGGLILQPGNYSKLMTVEVFIPPGYESQVVHLLTGIRAVPVMFVAGDNFDSAVIYGILGRGWNAPLSVSGGIARIELRGLT